MSKIIREDISNGTAKYPIPVVNNVDNESLDPKFLYVNHNVDNEGVFKDINKNGCKCKGECKPLTCECIKRSEIELYKDGRVKFASKLNKVFYHKALYECDKNTCSCGPSCSHRMTPEVFNLKVEVFKTQHSGYGVRSLQYIECGTFIAQFVGEVLTINEAHARTDLEDYSFLVERSEIEGKHYVDPSRYGNISRFFNHSCFENLLPIQFYSGHRKLERPAIGFVACRDILPNDELTIDYGTTWWERIVKEGSFFCQCSWCYCIHPSSGKPQKPYKEAVEEAIRLVHENRRKLLEYKEYHKKFENSGQEQKCVETKE